VIGTVCQHLDPTQDELPGTRSPRELHYREQQQKREREFAEQRLLAARGDMIKLARTVAREIAERDGQVTSPQVVRELRARGHGPTLDKIDRRFMGPVFRKGWKRVGYANEGSHGAAVSVWELQ
jgi:hypothetical protein